MGGIPEILAGLEKRAIEGGILSPPIVLKAKKLGFKELLDIGTLGVPYEQSNVVTSKGFIRKSEEIVRRFIKAYVEGIHFFKTNRESSIKVISKYTRIAERDVLEETYEIFGIKYLPSVPYPSLSAVKFVLEEEAKKNPKALSFNPHDFIEPKFVKELDESGFIKRLYER